MEAETVHAGVRRLPGYVPWRGMESPAMMARNPISIALGLLLVFVVGRVCYLKLLHPLARFPGPALAPLSNASPIVRIAPNHLSFGSHGAQKAIYGFNTRTGPSMAKDPIFFTPEVDHSMNIINETNREEHTRMRRMLSFAFSNSNLLENEDVLVRRTDEFLKTIGSLESQDGRRGFSIVRQFNYVTFNIMGEMSFGASFDARLGAQPEHRYHWADVIVNTTYMNDVMRAVCVVPGLFSLLEWLKPQHMRNTLYQHAEQASEHTECRLKAGSTRKDFMHHILTSKGPRPSTLEIGSHFNVIMMAGAVTTATFLSAVTYYLGHNKAALSRLQRELRTRFASLGEITSRDLLECEYLNAVVEEGLRIYPPAGAAHLSRIVPPGGCEIEGEWIPGGVRPSLAGRASEGAPPNELTAADRLADQGFRTLVRWIKSEAEGQGGDRLETSLPFSYGPRGCLGKNLAYLEMRMVLAKLFWQYDLAWFNSDEIDWERDSKGYTLWEKPDLRVLLRDHHAGTARAVA
ncbi:unnamed protein product [Diplocarpon coronariae]|nr:toxin biosynthesis cytochrome P450 monooxygenase [Diplocarpon mali]